MPTVAGLTPDEHEVVPYAQRMADGIGLLADAMRAWHAAHADGVITPHEHAAVDTMLGEAEQAIADMRRDLAIARAGNVTAIRAAE